MKTNNYLFIGVVLVFSIVISIIVPPILFKHPTINTVENVPIISNNFSTPSTQYFNQNSVDLTPYTQITNQSNASPFASTTP